MGCKMASQSPPDGKRSPALTDAELAALAEAPGDLERVNTSPRFGLPKFRLLKEIRKRNVGRVALLYVVVSWLILERVHVVFHVLEVPAWANRLVIILLALGFPAAMIFAWVAGGPGSQCGLDDLLQRYPASLHTN
jgi:hypothetical protein